MKMQVCERVLIPCESFGTFEEFRKPVQLNEEIPQPASAGMEGTSKEEPKTDGVIIRGKLIRCNLPTRNGISYTQPSMEKFVRDFNSAQKTIPFLDSHDDSSIRRSPPFGHITKLSMQGPDVLYEANIDPEEKQFLHKLKRRDLGEVSLQAIVDAIDEVREMNGDNSIVADVRELLEVSCVLIPGAKGTSVELQNGVSEERFVEAFKNANKSGITVREALKKIQEVKDNNELMGGPIEREEEELDTSNGGALIGTVLPKKVKKVPEEILKKSECLRVITKRF